MAKGRVALAMLEREHPRLYEGLFLQNRSIRYDGDLLHPLCDLGLVRQEGKRFRSSYRVRLFRGLFIITDPFTLPEQDRVFPLSEDESLFLAAHLHVERGDVVLDVGTGSGIQALCAARRAKHVVPQTSMRRRWRMLASMRL